MKKEYEHYKEVTREILDTIQAGNLVKINDWAKPMRVKAVSENYFVMVQNLFGKTMYSVCCKLPWTGTHYNAMVGGMFHCGPDDWIFGSPLTFQYKDLYRFENAEANQAYLQELEAGNAKISERNGVAIFDLYVKR